MSAADAFGLVVSLRVFALPGLRAVPRGALLDERPGNRPDPLLRGRPDRARLSARPLHGAGLRGERFRAAAAFGWPIERGFYRLVRIDAEGAGLEELREDACSSSASSSSVVLYAIQRLQAHLFLNPDHLQGVPSHIAFNTAASFITNTNWQFYGGEYTMSYLTQMAGLAVQKFVSAAVGMAVLAAVVRGFARRSRGARQLLARPLPLARLHPAAAVARPRA